KNLRVLQRKLQAFAKEGPYALINKHFGKKRAYKLHKAGKTVLRGLYRQPNKFLFTQIHRQYNRIAAEKGWSEISLSTVKKYLSQPAVQMQCIRQREGEDYFRKHYEPLMTRKRPTYPNDMWVMDGTPIELYYRDHDRLGRLNLRKRLYGFVVMDCQSWKVLGFAHGESETQELVFQAIKNAVISTGVLPAQIQSDNSSALRSKEMREWFDRLSSYVTPAAVGNARAKVVEPFFGQLNRQILKFYHNHSGGNITARTRNSRPNEEWLAKHPEAIPTKDQAIRQLEQAVELWNSRQMADGSTPNEKHETESPRSRPVELLDLVHLFWRFRMETKRKRLKVR
ncbi:MAG: DDE-type integrase/transposase/recombinase, partial [Bacteroidota bacterium]